MPVSSAIPAAARRPPIGTSGRGPVRSSTPPETTAPATSRATNGRNARPVLMGLYLRVFSRQ
jgi:hypothetical protein